MKHPGYFAWGFSLMIGVGYGILLAMRGDFDPSNIRLPGSFEQRRNLLLVAMLLAFITALIVYGIHG